MVCPGKTLVTDSNITPWVFSSLKLTTSESEPDLLVMLKELLLGLGEALIIKSLWVIAGIWIETFFVL